MKLFKEGFRELVSNFGKIYKGYPKTGAHFLQTDQSIEIPTKRTYSEVHYLSNKHRMSNRSRITAGFVKIVAHTSPENEKMGRAFSVWRHRKCKGKAFVSFVITKMHG